MEAEKKQYAIMLDISGSTGGSVNYYEGVRDVLAMHGQNISQYYFWDSQIDKVDKKKFEKAINERRGRGGTTSSLVAKEAVKQNLKNIILITDGQVSDHDVQNCDKILQDYQFNSTICYIIASSSYGQLNMSVTCPFTRKCENEVYEKREGQAFKKLVQYTPEDYKILDTLDDITLENFQANYDQIQGLIIALNMGKQGNIPLKNQLVVMKNRLVKELSKKKDSKDNVSEMRALLEKGKFNETLEIAREITDAYFSDNMTTDLEKKISHLINLCGDLRGKYDIGQIKSNKMAIAKDAKEGKLQEVQVNDLSKNPIECPIIMDQDVPQILVDEAEPIFLGVEKPIIEDISACPLRLLNYPQVKAKLKSRLSKYMGVKYTDKFLKNPYTQNKLMGSIPLGCHKSHVTVGNATIAKMFSDGKILGNLNMFYAAIWYIVKEKQIEYLNDIQKNLTEHLLYRVRNSRTFASMCGLAQFVTTQMTTDVAIWYCVNSCCLEQPGDRDTFRFHLYNIAPMMDILKQLGYPIHEGVTPHLNRTKAILNTLAGFKRLNTHQKVNFKEGIRCLYQNSIKINKANVRKEVALLETFVKYIPIDGKPSEQRVKEIVEDLPKDLKGLSIEEIVHIGNLMDAQKSAADLPLEFNFKPKNLPEAEINWPYGLKEYKEGNDIKINPKTFRLQSRYGNRTWEQKVEEDYKMPVGQMFKGRKFFQNFLLKYNQMPTLDELILFYYNRYVQATKKNTLPFLTEQWAHQFLEEYTTCMKEHNIEVKQAISLLEKSRPRDNRAQIEAE